MIRTLHGTVFRRRLVAAAFLILAAVVVCEWDVAFGAAQEEMPSAGEGARSGVPVPLRATETSPGTGRPNVLLIGIETLRADHVGCLGYPRDTTPNLDRLAGDGVRCTKAMSTSGWTLPSVMSVMTSLYPGVHRVQTYRDKLPGGITTLAEVMKAAGYATFGITSNPLTGKEYGFSDGFDLYDDFTVSLDAGMDVFGNNDEIIQDHHLSRSSELVTRVAAKWLRERPAGPFFLFAFYFDPHYDYIPPAPFDALFDPNYDGSIDGRGMNKEPRRSQRPSDRDLEHIVSLYDGEIRYTDGYVGKLLDALDESGTADNTLVVLFGDHGDEFYEHGKATHARTLYNEIVHVPLILRWPARLPAGKRIDAVTSLVDILPTIVDCLELPYRGPMQGISLRALVEGTAAGSRNAVWAELDMENQIQALLRRDARLMRNVRSGTWELYDLSNDPGEQINLYDRPSARDLRLAMTAAWKQGSDDNERLVAGLSDGKESEQTPWDPERLRQLKALGYVQ